MQNNTQLPRETGQNEATDTREILEHKSLTYHWFKNNDKWKKQQQNNLVTDYVVVYGLKSQILKKENTDRNR